MAGGSWDPLVDEVRPGLYVNFKNAATAQITGGPRGIVAIPLATESGTATPKTIYELSGAEGLKEAETLFGAANIQSLKFIMQGGARDLLVYTMPADPQGADYTDMRDAFDAYYFNVFVYDGEVSDAEQDAALLWMQTNRDEGKHFEIVFGGPEADDADPVLGNANSTRLKDEYAVNLIVGAKVGGVNYSSGKFAPYIAGLIAGTGINRSITYADIPIASDVTKRLTGAQIKAALTAGSLVLVNEGDGVRVERGVATDGSKIRKMRARQAIITDVARETARNYIGKVDNNIDGQKALIAAVKSYLESLANANVLTNDITVELHPDYPSTGDKVFLLIKVTEVDSMEEIYIDIVAAG